MPESSYKTRYPHLESTPQYKMPKSQPELLRLACSVITSLRWWLISISTHLKSQHVYAYHMYTKDTPTHLNLRTVHPVSSNVHISFPFFYLVRTSASQIHIRRRHAMQSENPNCILPPPLTNELPYLQYLLTLAFAHSQNGRPQTNNTSRL